MQRYATWLLAVAVLPGCALLLPAEAGDAPARFEALAPALGASAPALDAVDLEGHAVTLADLQGRPLVLQLGSYTCPVFRNRRFAMRAVRAKWQDRVNFLVLYTQEAHPVGSPSPYRDAEWVPLINRLTRATTRQPTDLDERLAQARLARSRLRGTEYYLVDLMDNAGWQAFGRASAAAFVIDRAGRVVHRQARIEPQDLDRALERLLTAGATPP